MGKPVEDCVHGIHFAARGQRRALHHQYRYPQLAGGQQLGARTFAAGVLADDKLDAMALEQRKVALEGKWATIDHYMMVGQGDRRRGWVDQAQHIVMLSLRCEFGQMHAPQRQQDALRRTGQRGDRSVDVGDLMPAVAGFGRPWRTGQGEQRHPRDVGCRDGVGAHLHGKRVGGIDQVGDALFGQVTDQAVHAAEAAHTCGQRLNAGILDPAGVAEAGAQPARGQRLGEQAGFGGAAQEQDVGSAIGHE